MFTSYAALIEVALSEEASEIAMISAGSAIVLGISLLCALACWGMARVSYEEDVPRALMWAAIMLLVLSGVVLLGASLTYLFRSEFIDAAYEGTEYAIRILSIAPAEAERLALDYANVVGPTIAAEPVSEQKIRLYAMIATMVIGASLVAIPVFTIRSRFGSEADVEVAVSYLALLIGSMVLTFILIESMPATPAMDSLRAFDRYVYVNGLSVLAPVTP